MNNPKFPILSLLFFCMTLFTLHAQDTIVVQTFDWNSTNRADTFQFPDDPSQSYEKILMIYNMHCHNDEVGNGAVGCREWDYSCNTFITDPSRQDSSEVTHPSHLITNFSGTTYDYTSQPTFSYQQFIQQDVNYTSVLTEETATLGTGTDPFNIDQARSTAKMHFLYTASEMATAGLSPGALTGLRLEIDQADLNLENLRLRLKATASTQLNAEQPELDGFQEVYFLTTQLNNSGWHNFNFHSNFDWDGTANIIVELSWSTARPGALFGNQVKSHDAGFDAVLTSQTANDDYLHFAGSGVVNLPVDAFSTISNEITLAFWNYGLADALPANSTMIEGLDADDNRQVNIHLPWSNGQVYWDCGNDGGGFDRINKVANTEDFEGQWNHWTFTKNAQTGQMKIYLNGTLWHSGAGKFKAIDVQKIVLGASSNWGLSHLGQVDELSIWSKELSAANIQQWMNKSIDASHPNYSNLEAYYSFDDISGSNVSDASANGRDATIIGSAGLQSHRGEQLFKHFSSSSQRPNLTWVQGTYETDVQSITVLDSTANAANRIIRFTINGGSLERIDTVYRWEAGEMLITDAAGDSIGVRIISPEAQYNIEDLKYFNTFDSKYEILSLVTPYGNGLDLGPEGKTFTIDVTDYAPILRGEKRMSIELGGQWQEDLDIKFLFIKGTPPRDVIDIQNIWPFARGGYANIQSDRVFEPRMMSLPAAGSQYKLRSAITGHGQNGEFVPRTHYLNLNGGAQDFTYQVWKACSENPIFPQGGTWTFDRAGWCPGMATDVHEFDITNMVSPGGTVMIDYGVNGALLTEANYLVSNQLVTYGLPNFQLEVELVDIYRPSKQFEFERINPACNRPQILIRNNGANDLTSLKIYYGLEGGQELTYNWSGQLGFLETELVELPFSNLGFWSTNAAEYRFKVRLEEPNGGVDENLKNNSRQSSFVMPTVFEFDEMQFYFRTNNRAAENSYTISDHSGQVLVTRDNLLNDTEYIEDLNFPPGCYSLDLQDTGGDGIYYWYWAAVGEDQGFGEILFRRIFNNVIEIPLVNFEREFGGSIHFDFIIPETVSNENLQNPTLLSVFPNPVADELTVELKGFRGGDFDLILYDLRGKELLRQVIADPSGRELKSSISMSDFPAGMYIVKLRNGDKVWVREVVKM